MCSGDFPDCPARRQSFPEQIFSSHWFLWLKSFINVKPSSNKLPPGADIEQRTRNKQSRVCFFQSGRDKKVTRINFTFPGQISVPTPLMFTTDTFDGPAGVRCAGRFHFCAWLERSLIEKSCPRITTVSRGQPYPPPSKCINMIILFQQCYIVVVRFVSAA